MNKICERIKRQFLVKLQCMGRLENKTKNVLFPSTVHARENANIVLLKYSIVNEKEKESGSFNILPLLLTTFIYQNLGLLACAA